MYDRLALKASDPDTNKEQMDVYTSRYPAKLSSVLAFVLGGPWDVVIASHMYATLLTGKRTIVVCCHSDGGPSFTLIMSSPNGCSKHLIDRKARQT